MVTGGKVGIAAEFQFHEVYGRQTSAQQRLMKPNVKWTQSYIL
jgi:hypothetical protein